MPWFVAQRTAAKSQAYAVLVNAPFETEDAAREHARRWERETAGLDPAEVKHVRPTVVVSAASDPEAAAAEMARRAREEFPEERCPTRHVSSPCYPISSTAPARKGTRTIAARRTWRGARRVKRAPA